MAGRIRIVGLCAAVAGTALVGGATASAKTTAAGAHAASAGKQTARTPQMAAAVPAGYLVVSAGFTAGTGVQTRGTVACPVTSSGATRSPQGGGVIISSSDLNANVNSSFPSGASWIADVNNNSGASTSFTVYAVCIKPHVGYTVATTSVTNFAGSQNTGTAVCPTGTRVLGGGALSSSGSVSVNINTSIPSGSTGWRVDMNNATASDTSFTVYALCSKYPNSKGYTVVAGASVPNPNGTETLATATCPTGTVPLGGGGFSGSGSTAVNMNSTAPSGTTWRVWENNNSGADTTLTPYAVCGH